MTIKLSRSDSVAALNALSPYLAGAGGRLGLRVQEKKLELYAHADHGSALARLPVKSADRDWAYVDGQTLLDAIKLADGDVAEIAFHQAEMSLKFARSVSKLRFVLGVQPDLAQFCEASAAIKGKDLALLSTMTEAASTDETRPNLNGIFLSVKKGSMNAAASDGFILSFTTVHVGAKLTAGDALYSVKALNRAKRAIKPSDDEDIPIGFDTSGITVSVRRGNTDFLFTVPRIDGNFPNYMEVVNGHKQAFPPIQMETKSIEAFLKRAKAIEGEAVYLQALNGRLWMLAVKSQEQRSLDSVKIDTTEESPAIRYATAVLSDAVKACAANDRITLTFPLQDNAPVRFRGDAEALAMPLLNDLKESPFKGLQPTLV